MKAAVSVLAAMFIAGGALAKEPYRDFLPGLPSAPPRQLESDGEFFSQPHDEEAHFFAKISKESYVEAVRAAANGDAKRLQVVLRSARHQDGAGAEGYASTLFWLMRRIGDMRFAAALRAQPFSLRKRLISLLDYGAEYDYSAEFPRTFSSARHEPQ